jgi:hypothetical protein
MTVLSFPGPRPRLHLAGAAEAVPHDLPTLLETDFPEPTDDGACPPEATAALAALFCAFGLALPAEAEAADTHALWQILRFEYGRIVRVVLRGADPERACPGFSMQELAYGRTVAQGEVAWATRLARPLLGGKGFGAFLR